MAFAARSQTEQARVCRRDDQDQTMYQEGADTHIEETRPRHRQYLQDNARLRLEKNDHFDKLEGLSGTPEKIQKQVDISPVYTTCVNGRRRNSP
jgi:hypothetical protein